MGKEGVSALLDCLLALGYAMSEALDCDSDFPWDKNNDKVLSWALLSIALDFSCPTGTECAC